MKATLFVMPGSHPSRSARMMLEAKGIPYRRLDLIPVLSKGILRAAGFPAATVPALRLDGNRVQGSRAIARELDRLVPEPAFFPADPGHRARVEQAELWGDEVLQGIARRLIWNILSRDPRGRRSYLEGAKLGVPIGLAVKTAAPLVMLSKRFSKADDEAVRGDLAGLPDVVDKVDELLETSVIGNYEQNVADYQIAPSLRLLMTMDDVRPLLRDHPAAEYAMWLLPEFPGYAPAALPDAWKPAPE